MGALDTDRSGREADGPTGCKPPTTRDNESTKRTGFPTGMTVKRPYGEYLRSETWKKRRALVMGRAKGRCEVCRVRKARQVHHLTYERIYNAVCARCHQIKHPDRKITKHKPRSVYCPYCPKRVTSEHHLKLHMDARHGPDRKSMLEQLEHERRDAERERLRAKAPKPEKKTKKKRRKRKREPSSSQWLEEHRQ